MSSGWQVAAFIILLVMALALIIPGWILLIRDVLPALRDWLRHRRNAS